MEEAGSLEARTVAAKGGREPEKGLVLLFHGPEREHLRALP